MKEIGIELTPVQSTLFKRLDKRKGKKRLREKDPKTKRRRALKGCLKIAAENKKTIKSMKKNMGYRTGVNMEPDVDPGEGAKQPAAKRRKSQKDLVCKDCKEQGHGTKRSRACRFNATENPLHVLQNLDLNDGKSRRRWIHALHNVVYVLLIFRLCATVHFSVGQNSNPMYFFPPKFNSYVIPFPPRKGNPVPESVRPSELAMKIRDEMIVLYSNPTDDLVEIAESDNED
jgi:hypothetical protein